LQFARYPALDIRQDIRYPAPRYLAVCQISSTKIYGRIPDIQYSDMEYLAKYQISEQ